MGIDLAPLPAVLAKQIPCHAILGDPLLKTSEELHTLSLQDSAPCLRCKHMSGYEMAGGSHTKCSLFDIKGIIIKNIFVPVAFLPQHN